MSDSNIFSNHRVKISLIGVGIFGILFARTLNSFEKFPADPGYDYLYLAATEGIKSWFGLDPYLHIGAHFLGWLASLAPLSNQAVALSIVVNATWSIIGVGIFTVLRRDGMPQPICFISTLALPLCPAASESSLANIGNIKWPMLILAILLASSKQILRSPILSSSYFLITGLTNPLTPIVYLPLLMNLYACNPQERKKFVHPVIGLSVSFLIQAIIVGSTGLTSGSGGDKTYGPWPGMGIFWWAGLVGPLAICVLILIVYSRFDLRPSSLLTTRLAVSGLLLSIASYLYGGIADRYFVAPMVISWIASISMIGDISKNLSRRLRTVTTIFAAFVFAVPVIYWFDAMWFLTAGPKWSAEVSTAIMECKNGSEIATLYVGQSATELPCSYILNN